MLFFGAFLLNLSFLSLQKGKIPEHSCHGGHEGGEHYEGYEDHGGYRAATPDRPQMNPAHMPMDVAVWTNRQKQAKKHPCLLVSAERFTNKEGALAEMFVGVGKHFH